MKIYIIISQDEHIGPGSEVLFHDLDKAKKWIDDNDEKEDRWKEIQEYDSETGNFIQIIDY